jgi:hypothetical protein
VIFGHQPMPPKNYQRLFIARVWGAFSITWPFSILISGQKSTKCAKEYFIYEPHCPQIIPDLENVKGVQLY